MMEATGARARRNGRWLAFRPVPCALSALEAALLQVKRDPGRLEGQPVAVVQYNPRGDLRTHSPDDDRLIPASPNSIIAVSYVSVGGLGNWGYWEMSLCAPAHSIISV